MLRSHDREVTADEVTTGFMSKQGGPPAMARQRLKKTSLGTGLSGGVQNLETTMGSIRFWATCCPWML